MNLFYKYFIYLSKEKRYIIINTINVKVNNKDIAMTISLQNVSHNFLYILFLFIFVDFLFI